MSRLPPVFAFNAGTFWMKYTEFLIMDKGSSFEKLKAARYYRHLEVCSYRAGEAEDAVLRAIIKRGGATSYLQQSLTFRFLEKQVMEDKVKIILW